MKKLLHRILGKELTLSGNAPIISFIASKLKEEIKVTDIHIMSEFNTKY